MKISRSKLINSIRMARIGTALNKPMEPKDAFAVGALYSSVHITAAEVRGGKKNIPPADMRDLANFQAIEQKYGFNYTDEVTDAEINDLRIKLVKEGHDVEPV